MIGGRRRPRGRRMTILDACRRLVMSMDGTAAARPGARSGACTGDRAGAARWAGAAVADPQLSFANPDPVKREVLEHHLLVPRAAASQTSRPQDTPGSTRSTPAQTASTERARN